MMMSFDTVKQAVAARMSPTIASRMDAAADEVLPDRQATVTEDEAGEIIAVATLPFPAQLARETLERLGLELAELRGPTGTVSTLDAGDLFAHPLLGKWMAPTVGEAVAAPIKAGALSYNCLPGCPTYQSVELLVCEGEIVAAVAAMTFPQNGLVVTSLYGPLNYANAPAVIRHYLSGDALFICGQVAAGFFMAGDPHEGIATPAGDAEVAANSTAVH